MLFTAVINNYVCTTGLVHDSAILDVDLVLPSSLLEFSLFQMKMYLRSLRLVKVLDMFFHKELSSSFQVRMVIVDSRS